MSPATGDTPPPPSPPAPPLPAAPGEERWAALALVNTRYQQQGRPRDGIATPDLARAWLDAHSRASGVDPATARLTPGQVAALHALRAAIRTLLRARIDGTTPPPGAVETVNETLRAAPTVRALSWPPSGVPGIAAVPIGGNPAARALAALAGDALDLVTGPDAAALAACAAPGCVRMLVRTHGKRQWCSTRCGDRVRAARHYARTHPSGTG